MSRAAGNAGRRRRTAPEPSRPLAGLEDGVLECRAGRRHVFRPVPWPAELWVRTRRWRAGRGIAQQCERCGTMRVDLFDLLGRRLDVAYLYPPGYLVAAEDRPAVEELRAEWLHRWSARGLVVEIGRVIDAVAEVEAEVDRSDVIDLRERRPRRAARAGAAPARRRAAR